MADIKLTSGGKERISAASTMLEPNFRADPMITYLLWSGAGEAAAQRRLAVMPHFFSVMMKAAGTSGATFAEASDWDCCAVWIPPGRKLDHPWTMLGAGFLGMAWNVGLLGTWRMAGEYGPFFEAPKKAALKERGAKRYHYLFFIATKEECRGRGLSSALIRDYQTTVAAKDGLPIWLEATSPRSRDLYLKLGFELKKEVVFGKGKTAADGTYLQGGEGMPIWGMIWWPPKLD